MNIFKLKTIKETLGGSGKKSGLTKTLGVWHLLLLAFGAIIGTGIFSMTGVAAVNMSGPAVIASYAIAGVTAIFIALVYTEIATMIPSSGGAYSYAFVAFGEIIAWMVSWMMILYFATSASTVAVSWSGYMVSMLREGGIEFPLYLAQSPAQGGVINLPASLICLFIAAILVRGTKESVTITSILVATKIIAIALFVYVAAPHFDAANWFEHHHPFQSDLLLSSPFMPFGVSGVITGAAFVFFAYNGFDAIASTAEECKNPKRDLMIAILGSLLICIVLYMVVSALLVGMVPFNLIDISSPLSSALSSKGHNIMSSIISAGVVIGMLAVILVHLFALSRIILATARDGLLPSFLAKVHPKYRTPHMATITFGVIAAFISGLVPLEVVGTLSSVGTLFSFIVVGLALIVLRHKYPKAKRPFKCPWVYFVSGMGVLLCLVLLIAAMKEVGIYAMIWIGTGIAFYFTYYTIRVKQH
jgi:basic amino acid/polyamine antiporter, APA family